MPIYTIRHKTTGETHEEDMTISEMVAFEVVNPDYEVLCGAPGIGYHFTSLRPSDDFRNRLKEMKKHHPGNTINIR